MRKTINRNEHWAFRKEAALSGENREPVTLPHAWNALDGQDGGGDYYQGTYGFLDSCVG